MIKILFVVLATITLVQCVEHTVTTSSSKFNPKTLRILPGDTVIWTALMGGYNVAQVPSFQQAAYVNGSIRSGEPGEAASFAFTFNDVFLAEKSNGTNIFYFISELQGTNMTFTLTIGAETPTPTKIPTTTAITFNAATTTSPNQLFTIGAAILVAIFLIL